MIQYECRSWQQQVPLSTLTRDDTRKESVSKLAGTNAAQPDLVATLPSEDQSSQLPLVFQDSDYQWLILL
jgi:hypothetical protein